MSIRSHLHRLPVALICAGCLTPGLAAAVPVIVMNELRAYPLF